MGCSMLGSCVTDEEMTRYKRKVSGTESIGFNTDTSVCSPTRDFFSLN